MKTLVIYFQIILIANLINQTTNIILAQQYIFLTFFYVKSW